MLFPELQKVIPDFGYEELVDFNEMFNTSLCHVLYQACIETKNTQGQKLTSSIPVRWGDESNETDSMGWGHFCLIVLGFSVSNDALSVWIESAKGLTQDEYLDLMNEGKTKKVLWNKESPFKPN